MIDPEKGMNTTEKAFRIISTSGHQIPACSTRKVSVSSPMILLMKNDATINIKIIPEAFRAAFLSTLCIKRWRSLKGMVLIFFKNNILFGYS